MKTRCVSLLIVVMLFVSCRTGKYTTSLDYIMVYDNYEEHRHSLSYLPEVLILKRYSVNSMFNSYEHYFDSNASIIGKWEMKGDTLYLFPVYEFHYDSVPCITNLYPVDTAGYMHESRINQKWLIGDDGCLYARTDLSVYLNEYDKDGNLIESGLVEVDNPNYFLEPRSKARLK